MHEWRINQKVLVADVSWIIADDFAFHAHATAVLHTNREEIFQSVDMTLTYTGYKKHFSLISVTNNIEQSCKTTTNQIISLYGSIAEPLYV